jgi:hypothetical protein
MRVQYEIDVTSCGATKDETHTPKSKCLPTATGCKVHAKARHLLSANVEKSQFHYRCVDTKLRACFIGNMKECNRDCIGPALLLYWIHLRITLPGQQQTMSLSETITVHFPQKG